MEYKLKDFYSVPKVRRKLPKDGEWDLQTKKLKKRRRGTRANKCNNVLQLQSSKYVNVMGHKGSLLPEAGRMGRWSKSGKTSQRRWCWPEMVQQSMPERGESKNKSAGAWKQWHFQRIPSNLIWLKQRI